MVGPKGSFDVIQFQERAASSCIFTEDQRDLLESVDSSRRKIKAVSDRG
jgi:hypothetical protein